MDPAPLRRMSSAVITLTAYGAFLMLCSRRLAVTTTTSISSSSERSARSLAVWASDPVEALFGVVYSGSDSAWVGGVRAGADSAPVEDCGSGSSTWTCATAVAVTRNRKVVSRVARAAASSTGIPPLGRRFPRTLEGNMFRCQKTHAKRGVVPITAPLAARMSIDPAEGHFMENGFGRNPRLHPSRLGEGKTRRAHPDSQD